MLTPDKIAAIHRAATIIEGHEAEGPASIPDAAACVGEEIAVAMFVIHYRRNLGSVRVIPATEPKRMEKIVNEILSRRGLVA